jgi:hypothetical protein
MFFTTNQAKETSMSSTYAHDGERIAAQYGVNEVGNIHDFTSDWHGYLDTLADNGHAFGLDEIAKLTRVRFVTDRGWPYLDLSYAMGELADGRHCRVRIESGKGLSFGRKTYRSEIAAECKALGVNANKLGVWDSGTYSILYG